MMTRNQREFWSLWRRVLGVAVATTVHRNMYRFTEARLAVVWRKKLTDFVHAEYVFSFSLKSIVPFISFITCCESESE